MKKIILTTTAIFSIAFLFVFISVSEEQTYTSISERNNQTKSFKGAHQYMMSLKADPATGVIPYDAVLNARQEVRDIVRTRSAAETSLVWKEMGPDNVGGRTRAILIDKDNPNKMFSGGVSGGLWLSNDAGLNWDIIDGTDALDFSGVVSICQTINGDIYFGTGESSTLGSFGGSSNGSTGIIGGGIYKSTDGGQTFEHLQSTDPNSLINSGAPFAAVTELAVHNDDPNTIYAATNTGLKITTDGGTSWTNAIPGSAVFFDVEVATDGSVLASSSNKIYFSQDGTPGSFDALPTGTTFGGGSGRIEVEFSPSDPNYIYAIFSNVSGLGRYKGIYRSTDKGQTWNVIIPGWTGNTPPLNNIFSQQANYAMALAVDPNDKDRIIIGGLDIWVWKEGQGVESRSFWASLEYSPLYVHADQHEILYHPTDPNIVYIGNDGGVFRSDNNCMTFAAYNRGYGVTQFYTVGFSKDGHIIGGTQDNGTQLINFENQVSSESSVEVRGGDGGYAIISHINPDVMFVESQYGAAGRSANGGESFGSLENLVGDTLAGWAQTAEDSGEDALFATFVNPMELWESVNLDGSPKDTSLFFAATNLISNNDQSDYCVFMTKGALDFSNPPNWFQVTPTGSTPITRMTVSPDGNHLYFARGSSLFRTDNLNIDTVADNFANLSMSDDNDFTPVVSTLDIDVDGSGFNTITSIAFDPNNKNTVVVTTGNFTSNNHVFISYNALDSFPDFTSIQANLPKMPVYSAVIDVFNSNNIILGTEFGVWASSNGGSSWNVEDNRMPLVPCHMLRQQTLPGVNKGVIYVGTHGRGFFKSASTSSISELNSSNENSSDDKLSLKLFPNPTTNVITIESALTNYDVQIFDLMGKQVFSAKSELNNLKLDVSFLETGTYIVITNGPNGKEFGQFVKSN